MERNLILGLAAGSLAWTWFAFFRGRVSIKVASKGKVRVLRRYGSPGPGPRPQSGLLEEWQHILVDTEGRQWQVTEAAYDRARAGRRIRLRQWVDQWRPCD